MTQREVIFVLRNRAYLLLIILLALPLHPTGAAAGFVDRVDSTPLVAGAGSVAPDANLASEATSGVWESTDDDSQIAAHLGIGITTSLAGGDP